MDRKGAAGNPFYITYLSPGLTWAPAYRIALGKESKLQLDQSATVINELEDLKDAELSFVSGFPNLEYIGVTSPLASGMTLQAFLQQLNANENGGTGAVMPRAMAQAAMNFKMEADSAVSPLPGTGLSEDIHFAPGGKVTLAKGDVLYKTLATARADYERLVEWEIPDRRDQWGRFQQNYGSRNENPDGDLWDAVRFRNPLKAPITTAPVEIVDGEKLLGQSTIKWVNPGEEALVLSALVAQREGDTDGGAPIPVVYLFTYFREDVENADYLFVHGQLVPLSEVEDRRVYEDERYVCYELSEYFYTDVQTHAETLCAQRGDVCWDEAARLRVQKIYDYYTSTETLARLVRHLAA